jgi:hypothetical protein|tara:strand:+ start:512 stop:721 length:210 start_codon:yes stop_codon:yes gene_type:complete
MSKSGYEFRLVDEGTLDTVISVSGSDVRYTYSQEYRNAFDTFDEFWAWVVKDIEEDIASNGLEEDLEDM